jgi:hypothetical protein
VAGARATGAGGGSASMARPLAGGGRASAGRRTRAVPRRKHAAWDRASGRICGPGRETSDPRTPCGIPMNAAPVSVRTVLPMGTSSVWTITSLVLSRPLYPPMRRSLATPAILPMRLRSTDRQTIAGVGVVSVAGTDRATSRDDHVSDDCPRCTRSTESLRERGRASLAARRQFGRQARRATVPCPLGTS